MQSHKTVQQADPLAPIYFKVLKIMWHNGQLGESHDNFIKSQQFKGSLNQCTLGHQAMPEKSMHCKHNGREWAEIDRLCSMTFQNHCTLLHQWTQLNLSECSLWSLSQSSLLYHTLSPASMIQSLMSHAFKDLTRKPIQAFPDSRIVQTSCLSRDAAMAIRLLHSTKLYYYAKHRQQLYLDSTCL